MHEVAATSRRELEVELVRDFLRDRYGLAGELRPLGGENHNFLVVGGEDQWILKISAHGQSESDVALELALIEHLVSRDFSLELPQAVESVDGRTIERFGDRHPARLMRRVAGTPWFEAEPTPALCEDLGRCLAELAAGLADFDDGGRQRDHAWSVERAAELAPEIEHLAEREHRRLLDRALGIYLAGALPRLPDLPHSWIHGDVNDGNLLVVENRLSGLIDFGDAVIGPTVAELAIALVYAMIERPDPLADGARIVDAYDARRTLSEPERQALVPLMFGRLLTSLAMSSRRRRQGLERENYFVTEAGAWELLARLEALPPAEIRRSLLGEKAEAPAPVDGLLQKRRRHIGPSLSIAYDRPLHIDRGSGQYLWDVDGRPYLDLVNNVCHVGHCHPRVVAAGQEQMARLNTNTRYLYDGLTEYAERLAATLPDPLEVCFFVTSGSEANELALRIARTCTGRRDVLVVEGAYHGHTNALIDISPYKFLGRGGAGAPRPWVHMVPMPDGYRGPYKGAGQAAGQAYGDTVAQAIEQAPEPVSCLILESLLGCGGQIIPPDGYLETAFAHVRAAGGLCIADEVQVGFGRAGSAFWAFETQGVVPDIVVLGKPIGNGHPMAAVVTTREIADAFANGMEFFSTFGGNPVSCAIGMAVLDVIEEERLQDHARELGAYFLAGLERLQRRHELIGAVRGLGLFLGVELVKDRDTLEPAAAEATGVVDRMVRRGVLLSTDGPLHNVLKIKPPMVLNRHDVDRTLRLLDEELSEVAP